ncbi:MAG: PcfK-like family protein [Duncaniella sp.]|nr:PcfK-like family protein [Duncaniella sp.]
MSKQATNTKGLDSAKEAIRLHLENRAKDDAQVAVSYAKEGKNIDECFRYILSEARKRGSAVCMTDEEVFGLAVHYYDEDDIKVPASVAGANAVKTVVTGKAKVKDIVDKAEKQVEEEMSRQQQDIASKAKPERKPKGKKPLKEWHEPYVQLSLFDEL